MLNECVYKENEIENIGSKQLLICLFYLIQSIERDGFKVPFYLTETRALVKDEF